MHSSTQETVSREVAMPKDHADGPTSLPTKGGKVWGIRRNGVL